MWRVFKPQTGEEVQFNIFQRNCNYLKIYYYIKIPENGKLHATNAEEDFLKLIYYRKKLLNTIGGCS